MSSFLCFICHSTVNMDTNEETREKFKELVGMHLNQYSHLCHICCHVLNKFWLFRSVCLKRSMEYPVLFSEKGTIYLHINDTEHFNLCPNETCQNDQRKSYHNPSYYYNDTNNKQNDDRICKHDFADYFNDNIDNNEIVNNFDYNYHNIDIAENINKANNNETDKQNNINKCDNVSNYFDSEIINDFNEGKVNNDSYNEKISIHIDDNINETKEISICNLETNNDYIDASNHSVDTNNSIDKEDATESIVEADEDSAKNTNHDVNKKVKKKKKSKKSKSDFEKIVLTLEQQKAELEGNRKQKKYMEAEFKCYNCALGFLFKDTYQTHMMRHEESNGEYRCTTCTLRFVTPAVFRAHTSLHTDRYKCVRCGLMMRLRQCKDHLIQCGGKGDTEEVVTCHLCGNVFKDSSGLSQHLRRFHKLKTKNRTYSCTVCGKTYNNQAAVRTHMIKHIQRQFHCEQCSSTFSSPYMLNQHKKKHDSTFHEQHYCTTCKIGYSTRKNLLAHKRKALVHQRAVFECRICSRLCPNRFALVTHMQRVHASCKQYACNVCDKRYATRPSLTRHEATHMPAKETKIHMCHMCPRTFKSRSKLNRHLREVCEKDKLEEELSIYYNQNQVM